MPFNSLINFIQKEGLKLLAGGVAGIGIAYASGFEADTAVLVMLFSAIVISATIPKRFLGEKQSRFDLTGLIFGYMLAGVLLATAIFVAGWGLIALLDLK